LSHRHALGQGTEAGRRGVPQLIVLALAGRAMIVSIRIAQGATTAVEFLRQLKPVVLI
jgi:hypothetical protein